MIRRAARTGAVVAAAVGAMGGAQAYADGPAQHFLEDVTGDTIDCRTETYTITSGAIKVVLHEATSASGNTSFTGTVTARHVRAEDEAGAAYSIRGTEWFGATSNARRGTFQATFTGHLQVVAKGSGVVDSVRVTQHITLVNGNLKEFDFGTCVAP